MACGIALTQTIRSDDALVFNKAKRQLLESMQKFQHLVPGTKTVGEVPFSWGHVLSATSEAQLLWEAKAKDSRVGRVKEWARKMCNGMNNHAQALKMLPAESEYVSLVAGAVSMIIKVNINSTAPSPPNMINQRTGEVPLRD